MLSWRAKKMSRFVSQRKKIKWLNIRQDHTALQDVVYYLNIVKILHYFSDGVYVDRMLQRQRIQQDAAVSLPVRAVPPAGVERRRRSTAVGRDLTRDLTRRRRGYGRYWTRNSFTRCAPATAPTRDLTRWWRNNWSRWPDSARESFASGSRTSAVRTRNARCCWNRYNNTIRTPWVMCTISKYHNLILGRVFSGLPSRILNLYWTKWTLAFVYFSFFFHNFLATCARLSWSLSFWVQVRLFSFRIVS